jgi:hypothetical protein
MAEMKKLTKNVFARCESKSINTLRHKGNVAIDVAINHEPLHICT